jgi:hypothetical protein
LGGGVNLNIVEHSYMVKLLKLRNLTNLDTLAYLQCSELQVFLIIDIYVLLILCEHLEYFLNIRKSSNLQNFRK